MAKEVVKKDTLPPALAKQMAEDAGKGVSTAQEDNLVPLIYILQSNSPQISKRSPDYIEGAEAGSIWLRNSPDPIVDGEKGFLFQPCCFVKDWVEWVPRASGGGYIGRHETLPEEAVQTPDPENPKRQRWMLPNGNEVVETRYHIGLVYLTPDNPVPYVIPMTSTGHTASRGWMTLMAQKKLPNGGGRAPSFACMYRVKTRLRSNAAGEWFTWEIEDAGWVHDTAQYRLGKELNDTFEIGAKTMAEPEAAVEQNDTEVM